MRKAIRVLVFMLAIISILPDVSAGNRAPRHNRTLRGLCSQRIADGVGQ